jgi:hypothetical protein
MCVKLNNYGGSVCQTIESSTNILMENTIMIRILLSSIIGCMLISQMQAGDLTIKNLVANSAQSLWQTVQHHPHESMAISGLVLWGGYEAIKQRSLRASAVTIINTVKEDFGIGTTVEKKFPHQIPLKSHIGHALRVSCYTQLLPRLLTEACSRLQPEQFNPTLEDIIRYCSARQHDIFHDVVLLGPLKEEIEYTYIPHVFTQSLDLERYLGSPQEQDLASQEQHPVATAIQFCFDIFAQGIMPIWFAYDHRRTHSFVMMMEVALSQGLTARCLAVQPGYIFSPLYSHISNNFFAYFNNQRAVEEAKAWLAFYKLRNVMQRCLPLFSYSTP